MHNIHASAVIVSIMAAIGIGPSPLTAIASGNTAPTFTAARAAIVLDGAIPAHDGHPVVFQRA
jgi:hypothetical protein